jgi:hypothetical protein
MLRFRKIDHVLKVGIVSQPVVDVTFTDEQIRIAREHSADIDSSTPADSSYDFARIQTGSLGQGAVTCYLLNDAVLGLKQMLKGRPDDGVDVRYNGFKFSVKTFKWYYDIASTCPDTWMLVRLGEFKNPVVDFHVACMRVAADAVKILGFISDDYLERVGVPVGPLVDEPERGRYQYSDSIAITDLKHLTPIKCFDCELSPSHRCKKWDCKDKGCALDESNDPYPFDGRSIFDDVSPGDL